MLHKRPSPCVRSLCLWVERGPLYLILLHRDGARAVTYGRAHGDPSPPYTGRSGGGGTRKRERTRSAQSRDLLRHCVARSRDNPGRRGGGDPPRHRSRDTRQIGWELRALGLVGPMPHLISKYTWNTHLFQTCLFWCSHANFFKFFLKTCVK